MKQKVLKCLFVLLIIVLIIAGCLFYAIYISPDKLTVKYDSISSDKIPDAMDNVTIGYFSDVYYMEFMDEKRLRNMLDKIEEANVDILLFGGDLFYDPANQNIDADTINKVTQMLTDVEAPLGKFYVLGDMDNTNADTRTLVSTILYNAGFEDMSNRNTKLHNGTMESINLIGVENEINGSVDIQTAFTNISEESFNVMFVHTPDTVASAPSNIVSLAVAGHSLGGQIHFPLIGSLSGVEGAAKYHNGSYNINDTFLRVSNGLGTHESDMRLFCPPQFNIFVLHKE